MQKKRKVPLRKCMGCNEMKEKKELIRIVKAPEKTESEESTDTLPIVSLDLVGKKSGRGAYICKNIQCFDKVRKSKRIDKVLNIKISEEIYDQMEDELKENG